MKKNGKNGRYRSPEAGSRPSGSRGGNGQGAARTGRPDSKAARGGVAVEAPVSVGQIVDAEIIGIGHDGEGVGRTADGFTLFVHGALPGERVSVRVEHVKKQFGYAKLLQVTGASADRQEPPCPLYAECGGCQLQHMGYDAQLRQKRQIVVDALERIGKLKVAGVGGASVESGNGQFGEQGSSGIVVHPTIGMEDPWRYRNKAQVPFGQVEGGLVGGFYAQGSHRIIDMNECLIQHEWNDRAVGLVKSLCGELGIRAYDEETGRGVIRHVVVKVGFRTGDIMVVLVTNGEDFTRRRELVEMIRRELPGVKSICQNINTAKTNVIFGLRTEVLWGEEYIHDYIGDVRFAISARSFYQVNPVQTERLYGKALEYAALSGGETVIDAYCGIGTISLFLAQHAERVYGVEIVPEAIEDARRNAQLNGLEHKAEFAVGAAEVVIPAWAEAGIRADVIVVDPPRKGCDPALLDCIAKMQPRRVVYVSCNPATLARDLRILEDAGYRTVEAQSVDMFPWTVHTESVVRLIRM
ncbi:23S rRNA (uracil(1939)-C(5))-methyltransferase RlmD [Paenibacillus sp. YN15]|uniref:23S rRNA (uracil(1939)-C(5))-methyltransferase RlmD n=1 Tax=Paenibacillus sp. YN15 TaxID=1742774 RepID=UPI000DCB473E|nr:23S rRNA (uracil(1939)-C(5))-methyltransferase RlmD [Paenibacillus sp. YN15]RAU93874.1 23S rRNA (uracil(1939)-C(5))-methyltransferase RlmD [Paenibacillus sp. YN15]